MKIRDINLEVREIIDANIEANQIVEVGYVVNTVIANHDAIEGDDVDFYTVCALKYVKSVVKRCVGKYDTSDITPDAQLVLDGFEYLQKAYSVERDGYQVLVPVKLCTDVELLNRASEFSQMAKGCEKHSKELKKYVFERASQFIEAAE